MPNDLDEWLIPTKKVQVATKSRVLQPPDAFQKVFRSYA
jgi:hypothetical protein